MAANGGGGFSKGRIGGNGRDSVPMSLAAVRKGDWLMGSVGGMGRVEAIGTMGKGRGAMEGFKVRLGNGQQGFIPRREARIMGYAQHVAGQ